MSIKIVEWTGSVTALLGSFLLATHGSWADYGFIAYLISNFFLIAFAVKKRLFGILSMQFGFTATSIIGIMNSQF